MPGRCQDTPPGAAAQWRTGSVLDIGLEEPGELVEVGIGLDVADDGDQGLLIDQRIERDVVEVELTGNRDHDAVELLLDQRAIGTDAELAAEHDVERVGRGAAGLVAELEPV